MENQKAIKNNKAILLNMLWSLLAVIVNYAINFFLTPYVTRNIGVDAYGFVTMANTYTTYIDILSVALNSFAGRFISISYHKKDYDEANRYFSSVIIADMVLAISVFIPSLIIIHKLKYLLNIPEMLVGDVKALFGLVLCKYLLTMLMTAFNVGTFIANRLDLSERHRAISYFINGGILLLLCVLLSPHVWYVGLAGVCSSLYLFIMYYSYTRKLTPELHCSRESFSMKNIKTLVTYGIWNTFNNLGNILNHGLDLLITNLMLNSLAMGYVSIAKSMSTICYALVTNIANAFKPTQLQYYAEEKKDELISALKTSMKITGLFCEIIISGLLRSDCRS